MAAICDYTAMQLNVTDHTIEVLVLTACDVGLDQTHQKQRCYLALRSRPAANPHEGQLHIDEVRVADAQSSGSSTRVKVQ